MFFGCLSLRPQTGALVSQTVWIHHWPPKSFKINLKNALSHIFIDSLGLYLPPEYLLNLLLNKYIQPVRENFKLIVNKLLKNAFGGNYESWTFYLSNTSSIHPIPSTFKSMKQTKNFCYLFLSLAPTRLIDQFCSFFWCKMDQSILFQKN